MKKKILFLSETVTMAHLIRPLKIASSLSPREYEIHFAATHIPDMIKGALASFKVHQIEQGVSESAFLKAISKGQHPYTEDILTGYVEEDLRLLREIKPDLVIGDMRLTLHISAKLMNIPYINISNSTWDSGVAAQTNLVPDIPVVRAFGVTVAQLAFPLIRSQIMDKLAAPFNQVAKLFGTATYGSYFDVLTSGEYTIYSDLKSLVNLPAISNNKKTVGALVYGLGSSSLQPLELPRKQKARVILSLGSSGPSALLQDMVDSLAQLDIELIVATGSQEITAPSHGQVTLQKYLALESVLSSADLLIFNGGSGTGYIGLSQAVPLLCIPSNIDQHQFSHAIAQKGAAQILRSDKFSVKALTNMVVGLLQDSKVKASALEIAEEMRNENPMGEIIQLIETILAPAKVKKSVIETIVADALRSPSGDNCQPWQFNWNGNSLLVLHHEARGAHSLNRAHHASILALGGLLESIEISASQFGLKANIKLLLKNEETLSPWAEIKFSHVQRATDTLALKLSKRCTDRRAYKGGDMNSPLFQEVTEMAGRSQKAGLKKQSVLSKKLINYFLDSENFLWTNKKTVADLLQWMRLNKQEATSHADGMSRQNAGVNFVDAIFLRILRRFPKTLPVFWQLGLKQKIRSMTKKNLLSSAGLLCITVKSMDAESICEAGRLAFRTWVHLNANGYGVQPLSFASTSVADFLSNALPDGTSDAERNHLRKGFDVLGEAFGLEEDEIPLWIFRTGVSEPMPKALRTVRRRTDEVLVTYHRKNKRIPVKDITVNSRDEVTVSNISKKGLGLSSSTQILTKAGPHEIQIRLPSGALLEVKARQVWQRSQMGADGQMRSLAGYELLETPPGWGQLLSNHDEELGNHLEI